jgi:hypothetical protein
LDVTSYLTKNNRNYGTVTRSSKKLLEACWKYLKVIQVAEHNIGLM